MALITCPECGHSVSDMAFSCPGCGYPIKDTKIVNTRRKKRPKLPNGYGTIKRLSGNRKKPFAAYPPVTEFNEKGVPKQDSAIGYFAKYNEAYAALTEWHRLKGEPVIKTDNSTVIISGKQMEIYKSSLTFTQIYDMYYNDKYQNKPGKKKLSESSRNSTRAAYKNSSSLHDKVFCSLVTKDLQDVVDSCGLKHSSLELIVSLFNQMYAYAIQNNLADKDYSRYVKINIDNDDEQGVPFAEEDIKILWENTDNKDVQMILVMIYSGFRISAYKSISVNKEEQYFQGGVKTKAGKNRVVPIHPKIYPFIDRINDFTSPNDFRENHFYPTLTALGIGTAETGEKHTPHDCRHTFSWLCDRFKVDDISKHMMMGHAIGGDVESKVYAHRTLAQLREEINKITL